MYHVCMGNPHNEEFQRQQGYMRYIYVSHTHTCVHIFWTKEKEVGVWGFRGKESNPQGAKKS